MIETIINNWFLILVFATVAFCGFLAAKRFLEMPTSAQKEAIKKWLLFAVAEAEKQLGSGTGQLKLRLVYDWALDRFTWLAFIPFTTFSGWVDESLEEMKKQLENKAIKKYIAGE